MTAFSNILNFSSCYLDSCFCSCTPYLVTDTQNLQPLRCHQLVLSAPKSSRAEYSICAQHVCLRIAIKKILIIAQSSCREQIAIDWTSPESLAHAHQLSYRPAIDVNGKPVKLTGINFFFASSFVCALQARNYRLSCHP